MNAPRWIDLRIGDLVVDAEHRPDERQLFLFSAASNNAHRIHYDLPYAQSEGYPALLVQGPLQRALMARFIMEWAGPSARLARLSLQHRSPAFARRAINFRAEVQSKEHQQNSPDFGGAELSISAYDDDENVILLGSASVLLSLGIQV